MDQRAALTETEPVSFTIKSHCLLRGRVESERFVPAFKKKSLLRKKSLTIGRETGKIKMKIILLSSGEYRLIADTDIWIIG